MIRKIAITGPESTCKSELSSKLAIHYRTIWVPEYARNYLVQISRPYTFDDIAVIADGQQALTAQLQSNARRYLFCDTDPLVTYIWSMFRFGSCDPRVEDLVESARYDLHLLCDIDVPWEDDPLREHPKARKELYQMYLAELGRRGMPFEVVSGLGNDRLKNAISVIESFFRG